MRVCCAADGSLLVHRLSDDGLLYRAVPEAVTVSSRLARSPRFMSLPDGQSIETLDNDAVDRWLQQVRPKRWRGLVDRLESHWRFVLFTVLAVALVVWVTARYGVPAAADRVAASLPAELLDKASEDTLRLLDQQWLQPSQLSVQRRQALQRHFDPLMAEYEDLRIRVAFRSSEVVGPNAFALPSGQILFTDAMVNLARHDDELLAVLAHEVGHVAERHSLRRLVQNSLYVFLLALISGDTSGTAEVVLGLPVLFAELAYSRAYETEADEFARDYLQRAQIPLHRFADLMLRIDPAVGLADAKGSDQDDPLSRWQGYLSTHPLTQERVARFQ